MKPPRRDWIVAAEASALLGVSTTYAIRLATEGRIYAEQADTARKVWLFYRPSVVAYQSARKPRVEPA